MMRRTSFGLKRFVFVSVMFLLTAGFFAVQELGECSAQLLEEFEIRCQNYWQVTYPDSVVTFSLTVENPSFYDDSFLVGIRGSLPEGWKADFYLQNRRVRGFDVAARRSVNLELKMEVPSDASPGDYQFTVYAQGKESASSRVLIVTVESLPKVSYDLELYCPLAWQVAYPGENLTFTLHVKNPAPYTDSFLVSVDNPALPKNWTGRFYVGNREVKSFSATPGETVTFVLYVGISETAEPDDYLFRVQVAGNYSTGTRGLTVTVKSFPRVISLSCPFRSRTILTGQETYYVVKVSNEGAKTENVFLEPVKSSETSTWDISLSKSQFTLKPGGSAWLTLNVKPPGIVEEKEYTVGVKAVSEDGELEATTNVSLKIVANYLLEISGIQPINPQVYQGENIYVVVTVRNMGESPVTGVKLKVNSTAIPNILVTPLDVLALDPKSSADFNVRIAPDTNLAPGDYVITIQAESSETKSSERAIAVSVASPIPWFWISIGVTVIATAVAVIAIERVVSKVGLGIRIRK